jgi:hypothetical protein
MFKRHAIIIISMCLCFSGLTFAGTAPADRSKGNINVIEKSPGSVCPSGTYFAQKEEKETPGTLAADDIVKAGEDAIQPSTVPKDKNVPTKPRELKPFTPSERVPADQGVDFPYDI